MKDPVDSFVSAVSSVLRDLLLVIAGAWFAIGFEGSVVRNVAEWLLVGVILVLVAGFFKHIGNPKRKAS